MLKHLSVKNYVLIEELEISFEKGLSIVTGETGAGKSILLGALGLILGQRADSGSLLNKKQKCIIEGIFNIASYDLKSFMDHHDLDYQDETSIRREINQEGKSRAFINDTPVNLSVLKDLSSKLVDIHSQHETLLLNNNQFQLSLLDAYAKNAERLGNYAVAFDNYKNSLAELKQLEESEQRSKSDADYFRFQFNELEEARLELNEQESLEQEQKKLLNAEEIRTQLNRSISILNGSEESLINNLSLVQQQISGLHRYESKYEELSSRLKSSAIELKDILNELESAEQEVGLNPARLEFIEDRLSLIYKLQQKHRVSSVNELIQLHSGFSEKLSMIDSLDEKIAAEKRKVEENKNEVYAIGKKLSKSRIDAIAPIEKEIADMLSGLSMPNAVLRIAVHPSENDNFYSNGLEQIQFLFSANKGIDFRELSKVASGGELSRLMLCIKALLAKISAMPTVIFDEIDSGISGETAARVGVILKQMSVNHQVIAISHLPQIASKGDTHFLVYKEVKKGSTRTYLKQLELAERINEIARMLSGEQLTEAALGNAREMLSVN